MATGVAFGCLAAVLGMCGLGAAGVYLVASRLGLISEPSTGSGLDAFAALALVLVLVAVGHVVASVWAWRTRPGPVRVVLTQAPHVAAYAAVPFWWNGAWSAWYIAWGALTLTGLAWLTVWFLRAPGVARRAIVYLAALGVVVAANVAGILAVTWDSTNGFGWKGQPTPWAAFTALSANSCLADHPYHNNGAHVVRADCPSGPDADFYAGDYDESGFDNQLCDSQPKQAFTKWWEWNRSYQLSFTLRWDHGQTLVDGNTVAPPYPDAIDSDTATIQYAVTLESATHTGTPGPFRMRADTITETWNVEFEPATIGGWKVCRIDIPDPITATFTPQ
ncbi:hypothetical protein [Phytohabitans rumicis]|uniref:hypothetical protein n=1 Tax=Phytohabitans rumicis TaxID=1076125 RepID=UPI001567495B|nr:hypothetical protein [Phytohabitans rumicis]